MGVYAIQEKSQWRLSPLTFIAVRLGEGDPDAEPDPIPWDHNYLFSTLKKGASVKFKEVRVPNDTGGFTIVAYELEVEFTPVQLVANYYPDILLHFKQYPIKSLLLYYGIVDDISYQTHSTDTIENDATVFDISTESIEVNTDPDNLETTFKIKAITSVDFINSGWKFFQDLTT